VLGHFFLLFLLFLFRQGVRTSIVAFAQSNTRYCRPAGCRLRSLILMSCK